jgi:putative ABC transport system permease protein
MSRLFSARLRKSLADMTRRKSRTLLVVLGIFVAVCGLTTINVAEDTLFEAVVYSSGLHAHWPNVAFQVTRADAPTLLPALEAVANVRSVTYQSIFITEWHVSPPLGHASIALDAYTPQSTPADYQLTAGRYPGLDEVVMLSDDQIIQPFGIGATVTVDTPGGITQLTVVGLAREPGSGSVSGNKAVGFLSEAELERLAGAGGQDAAQHYFNVRLLDTTRAQATAVALASTLQAQGVHVLHTDFPGTVQNAAELQREIDTIFTLLRILLSLAVALSAILILNTVITLVAEQTAYIGTMKALGGTRGRILRGYLLTVGIYGLLATPTGLALGIFAGYQLAAAIAPQIPLAIGPLAVGGGTLFAGLTVGVGVPLVAALTPVWNGTRISVREALSGYGISGVGTEQGGSRLARLGGRLSWITQTTWLGLRGAFRKRWRAALTLVTLAVSWAVFLLVQIATTSVDGTIGATFAHFNADVDVSLNQGATLAQADALLLAQPNVAAVEPFAPAGIDTRWGSLDTWGFEPETRLYVYQLTGGRWFHPGETNAVLLNADAINRTGLHVGDTLSVANAGHAATWTIIGTVDETTGGSGHFGTAITTVDSLYSLEGVPAAERTTYAERLMVQARDRSTGAVDRLTIQLSALLGGQSGNVTAANHTGASGALSGDAESFRAEVARHQRSLYILYYLLYGVALVVLLTGVLGLANALAASVLERRREIGMLRAMGASTWRVARIFWSEGLALTGMAWCFGVLLGLPLGYLFIKVFSRLVQAVDLYVNVLAFAAQLGGVVAVATLASLLPVWRASRVRVTEMLRYE